MYITHVHKGTHTQEREQMWWSVNRWTIWIWMRELRLPHQFSWNYLKIHFNPSLLPSPSSSSPPSCSHAWRSGHVSTVCQSPGDTAETLCSPLCKRSSLFSREDVCGFLHYIILEESHLCFRYLLKVIQLLKDSCRLMCLGLHNRKA